MNAKEKALKLINKFTILDGKNDNDAVDRGKQFALICVDEILSIQLVKNGYWQQVKTEINNL